MHEKFAEDLSAKINFYSLAAAVVMVIVSIGQVRMLVCLCVCLSDFMFVSLSVNSITITDHAQVVYLRGLFQDSDIRYQEYAMLAILICLVLLSVLLPLLYSIFTAHDPFSLGKIFNVVCACTCTPLFACQCLLIVARHLNR
jgi:hypothetical protein